MYQQKRVSLVLILRADCSLFALKPARSSPYLPPSMDIQQPTDAPISATVRFQPDHPGGDTYTGHYCPPLPGGIADASFYAHVLSSSVPGRTSDLVSIVQRYRLSGEVDDAYQAWAGQVGREPLIMFGVACDNDSDTSLWKMTKKDSLSDCP
jgi:hypothetical protein